jgi:excisionase family DNA binding protein
VPDSAAAQSVANMKAEIRNGKRQVARQTAGKQVGDKSGMREGELLTQEEFAAQIKVKLRTVERWQDEGVVPYLRMGKCVRFYWPAVLSHLIENFTVLRGPGPSGPAPCKGVFRETPNTAAAVPTESKTAK